MARYPTPTRPARYGYHVSYWGDLPSIRERGLSPRRDTERTWGNLPGVYLVSRFGVVNGPKPDAEYSVWLRFPWPQDVPAPGPRDAMSEWRTLQPVPPDRIEILTDEDGRAAMHEEDGVWRPLVPNSQTCSSCGGRMLDHTERLPVAHPSPTSPPTPPLGAFVVLTPGEAREREEQFRAIQRGRRPILTHADRIHLNRITGQPSRGEPTAEYIDRTARKIAAGRRVYGDLPRYPLSAVASFEIQPHPEDPALLTLQQDGHPIRLLVIGSGGYPLTWNPRGGVPLLTLTSKMAAPSFSLPAGPTSSGGSCAASLPKGHSAATTTPTGKEEKGRFICHSCYALGGNYTLDATQLPAQIRQAWVLQTCQQDPTGGLLAQQMVAALTTFAGNPCGERAKDRNYVLFGVSEDGQIRSPFRAVLGTTDAPDGHPTGYFRIHDGGDFTPGPKLGPWLTYLHAWVRVARALPYVHFWAPTRIWDLRSDAIQGVLRILASLPNVTIRPSAFYVGDLPPEVPGLQAGSTVLTSKQTLSGVWPCPVYQTENTKSCTDAGCRTCWDRPQIPVSYKAH